jgi:hypothetical protein
VIEMSIKNRDTLRINGYSVTAAGDIDCVRELEADVVVNGVHMSGSRRARYAHTHCAVIRLDVGDSKAAKEFAAKVVAAIDEPAALVGVGRSGTVLLFRTADKAYGVRHDHEAQHEFVFDGKQCAFVATAAAGQFLDVGAFAWRDGRSPLTVARNSLPPLFSDISTRAYKAIDQLLPAHAGARWGSNVVPPESAFDRRVKEIAANRAAGIVAATVDDDERLVMAHPTALPTDGVFGQLVHAARQRLARRA